MGKQYYCDYCDRSFPDSADNRKKHLDGVQHQRMKKLHYDSFRDASTILSEELAKRPCKRFQNFGECDFGDRCRFSHLTIDSIRFLESQAAYEKMGNSVKLPDCDEPSVTVWLAKRDAAETQSEKPQQISIEDLTGSNFWKLPAQLQHLPNVPPSIRPPTLQDFLENEVNTWG